MTVDIKTLEMAIVGFDKQIGDLMIQRRRACALLTKAGGDVNRVSFPEKNTAQPRHLSPAARKRIGEAQRKRWAKYRAKKDAQMRKRLAKLDSKS